MLGGGGTVGAQAEHFEGYFYIMTNRDGARNFKLVRAPVAAPAPANWTDVVAHRPTVKLDRIKVFSSFVAVDGRAGGLARTWVATTGALVRDGADALTPIAPEEPVFTMHCGVNRDFSATALRYTYSSPTCPTKTLSYDVATGTSALLKQTEVPQVDSSKCSRARWVYVGARPRLLTPRRRYRCDMIEATAADGTRVPISILYRPDAHALRIAAAPGAGPFVAPPPLHLYGYGSYGLCCDPEFDSRLLSLADRGVVCATAHIRGGSEMGRLWCVWAVRRGRAAGACEWCITGGACGRCGAGGRVHLRRRTSRYEAGGKLLTKRNTFTDFISCAEHLVAMGWGDRTRVAIEGASAGGLLMGVAVTMRPDLWRVVVGKVAFVDLMNSMCDPSIPLTVRARCGSRWGVQYTQRRAQVTEYDEWGNCNLKEFYDVRAAAAAAADAAAGWCI